METTEITNTNAAAEVAKAREKAAALAEQAAQAAADAAKLAEEHGIAEEPIHRGRLPISIVKLQAITTKITAALDALSEVAPDLALTTAERNRLNGSGVRRLGFITKIYETASLRPEFIPPFFDINTMENLSFNIEFLRNIRSLALAIDRMANDALLLSGDESFRLALMYYNSVRDAARRQIPGAQELFTILELFFRRGHRKDEEPTEPEVERDVRALLHGHKDGKIVIENEHPHMVGGKHVVVDETHKEHAGFKATEEGTIENL